MLRTVGDQPTLWESLLPAEALVMPAELERVDRLLDDERFFAPYGRVLPCHVGSAVDPDRDVSAVDVLEVPLPVRVRDVVPGGDRLDRLAAVLSDPAGWSGAASDDVDEDHHPLRAGGVDGLNEALLAKAVEAKVLKTNRVRADTTVVEANVAYPSDSTCWPRVSPRWPKTAKKLRAMGLATRTRLADKTRTVRSRAARSTPTCGAATTTSWPKSSGSTAELGRYRRAGRPAGRRGGAQRSPQAAHASATGIGPGPRGGR